MADVGRKLYLIQQLDLSIRDNNKRLQEIERELSNDVAVKKAHLAVEKATTHLAPLKTELRDLELQVQSTRQKQKASEQRLYSGTVSNPKELQDIENNIASLKRRQDELEDKMLELMMDIEAGQETLDTATQTLETAKSTSANQHKDLLAEQQTLQSNIVTAKQERQKNSADVEPSALSLYEQLAPNMAFRPVATLTDDNSCSICGVQQTSIHAQQIRRTSELSRCANCNRILITT